MRIWAARTKSLLVRSLLDRILTHRCLNSLETAADGDRIAPPTPPSTLAQAAMPVRAVTDAGRTLPGRWCRAQTEAANESWCSPPLDKQRLDARAYWSSNPEASASLASLSQWAGAKGRGRRRSGVIPARSRIESADAPVSGGGTTNPRRASTASASTSRLYRASSLVADGRPATHPA